jgi:hypothetical protein
MAILKPTSDVGFAAGLFLFAGAYGAYMGIRDANLLMMIVCPLILAFSVGVWFGAKPAAVGLIVLCILFNTVGVYMMVSGHFKINLLIRVVMMTYLAYILWKWMEQKDGDAGTKSDASEFEEPHG